VVAGHRLRDAGADLVQRAPGLPTEPDPRPGLRRHDPTGAVAVGVGDRRHQRLGPVAGALQGGRQRLEVGVLGRRAPPWRPALRRLDREQFRQPRRLVGRRRRAAAEFDEPARHPQVGRHRRPGVAPGRRRPGDLEPVAVALVDVVLDPVVRQKALDVTAVGACEVDDGAGAEGLGDLAPEHGAPRRRVRPGEGVPADGPEPLANGLQRLGFAGDPDALPVVGRLHARVGDVDRELAVEPLADGRGGLDDVVVVGQKLGERRRVDAADPDGHRPRPRPSVDGRPAVRSPAIRARPDLDPDAAPARRPPDTGSLRTGSRRACP
jgi:plasmid stabilization system protein ParE